ncbi:uncharacterized protein [Porites lutea]|uniref:uncharacterized protein n=1 Tax=Porites lutea TaxID=51062 RepID=UPI003CC5D8A1
MSSHLKCALTQVVFGVLLFVMGIVDLGVNYGAYWTGFRFFVLVCGVWMCMTGGILARVCKTSCGPNALACVFLTSSFCGIAVGVCYSIIVVVMIFCEYSCAPGWHVSAIVLTLGIVQCITGCSGCCWVTPSSSQPDQIFSPFTIPAGDAQMMPTCMPPRNVFQDNDRPPPYGATSQGPDLLLVPLEFTPMSLQSVVQQNDRPPPYTVDAQTCSHGSDLLLAPLETTPMPAQETGPPPPYHQISTTGFVMSSFHDGDQPPAYVCTDEQMSILGGTLARNREGTSCGRKEMACAFITSSLCGMAVGGCYSFLVLLPSYFFGYSCGPERTVAAIVLTLVIVQCITGCSGCYWVTSSSSQADQTFSPFTVPAGDAQMVPTCTLPRSVFEDNDRPPPYGAGSQGPELLLVPLEFTPMSLQSIVQQNDRPPPYTVDAQTCSRGSDLLLVPLEMTPMPPQETGPPPPYHQISTTESVMSSFHDGDQPPSYVCTDEQHRVTTYV